MRLHVLSDLHLEAKGGRDWRPPLIEADVVILAGDTAGDPIAAAAWATAVFDVPVLSVLGNHEFYGSSVSAVMEQAREINTTHEGVRNPVHVLEQSSVTIGGVRFLGCTLWTDFALFGEAREREAMATAKGQIPDYVEVLLDEPKGGRMAPVFSPADARDLHRRSRLWLDDALAQPFDGPTVVVTHHAPSFRSIAPLWQASITSAAFASDLDELIERQQPDLWIHGHVHDSADYRIGRTRVVCNPKGFGAGQPRFVPDMTIDVGPAPADLPTTRRETRR